MWGSRRRGRRTARIDTLLGQQTEIVGDIRFVGGLHIDGRVRGNVTGADEGAVLTLSEHGSIEGEVRVPNVILNGTVVGDVHCAERIELAPRARVNGDVYYGLIEMAMGAEVNGSLVHRGGEAAARPQLVAGPAEPGEDEEPALAEGGKS